MINLPGTHIAIVNVLATNDQSKVCLLSASGDQLIGQLQESVYQYVN